MHSKWFRKKWLLLIFAVLLLVVGGLVVLGRQHSPGVTATEVPLQKAGKNIVANGIIVPCRYTSLCFAGAGLVEEIYVQEGQKVSSGKLLVKLSTRDLQTKLAEANANYSKAIAALNISRAARPQDVAAKQARLEQAQYSYNVAKTEYDRNLVLLENGGLSGSDFDKIGSALAQAEADLKTARENLSATKTNRPEDIEARQADVYAAQAAIDGVKSRINDNELRAPFDGTVMYIDFHVGEYVGGVIQTDSTGSRKNTSIQFADISKWRAQTNDLSEMDICKVKVGCAAEIRIDALPDLKLRGKVAHIRPYGENRNGDMTYTVMVDIDENALQIMWNMKAKITLLIP